METKAVQAAADLDAARCRGNWAAIPELAKKYRRYHPDESVLDAVACLEAELVEQIARSRRRSSSGSSNDDDERHLLDTHQAIYVPSRLSFDPFESIVRRLTEISRNRSSELQTTDDRQAQFAKILLARIYCETGQYDKALEALQNLVLNINDATMEYGLVLLVQARTIKGLCYEQQDKINAAQDAFGAAWDIVEQHLDQTNDMLMDWIEESLYHGTLLCLRTGASPQKTLRMMRAYGRLSASHFRAFPWRKTKQWVLFKAYASYLTKLSASNVTFASTPEAALVELYQVTETLRTLFKGLVRKSDPKRLSKQTVEIVDIIVAAHDSIGWGEPRQIRPFLQFFQQTKEYTFNSPSISRHLFYTLLRIGSFDEARHAVRAYMGLCGATDLSKILETESLDIKEIHASVDLLADRIRILKESWDVIENETIGVLLAGVDLYGHHYNDGKTAVVMAEIAVELMERLGHFAAHTQEKCYRVCGIAYGLYAAQSDSPEVRSEQHQKAIQMLRHALNIYEDDRSVSWETWYELAVQQAVMRDVYAALSSVTRSIQLKKDHLPSWHLLALISSCKQNDNKSAEALQVIETGIEQSNILHLLNSIPERMPVLSWSAEKSRVEYFGLAESYIMTCMSQVQLLEKLEGTDTVLGLYPELFMLYTKLSTELRLGDDEADLPSRKSSVSSTSTDETGVPGSRRSSYDRPRSNSIASSVAQSPRRVRSSSSEDTRSDRKLSSLAPPTNSNDNLVSKPRSSSFSRDHHPSLRKKSMQLIDVGFARRIGTSTSQTPSKKNSSLSLQDSTSPSIRRRSSSVTTEYSLLSLLSTTTTTTTANSPAGGTASRSLFKTSVFISQRRERWHQILVKLWLLSTTTFIRAGMLEEATKAIMEAEQQILVGQMNDAGVWHQLGVVCIKKAKEKANEDLFDTGLDAFKKALAINPDHVETLVDMAQCFMEKDEWEVAEGLLDRATQGYGWDDAEAWYRLSVCYRHFNDLERAKDCLSYSLELSETTPLQPFALLPRFVN